MIALDVKEITVIKEICFLESKANE